MEMMMNETSIFSPFESHKSPRKRKRNGLLQVGAGEPTGVLVPRPRNNRRQGPHAPNITTPCPECYRTFWSWKALFGHMRCHPTRQYRGMNPRRRLGKAPLEKEEEFTAEDHELASCLLMLANGSPLKGISASAGKCTGEENMAALVEYVVGPGTSPSGAGRFECSSCKKVFSSHQALGGHRASHKNVKGCYAITTKTGDNLGGGHCSTAAAEAEIIKGEPIAQNCKQALASKHIQCHWEKPEPPSPPCPIGGFDLNLSADGDKYGGESRRSLFGGGLMLDLKLGL